jgi:hypothetical protein
MKHTQIRKIVIDGYDKLSREYRPLPSKSSRIYDAITRQRSKYESCGRQLPVEWGNVIHWCRQAACPTCSKYHACQMARKFVAKYPESSCDDYLMVTSIYEVSPSLNEVFGGFRPKRTALHKAVDYRRRAPGIDQAAWAAFGVVGSLEIDCFVAEDFPKLGTTKQQQYRALGFDPQSVWDTDPIWVATTHAMVHVGDLGRDAVTALFQSVAPVVHVQELREGQTVQEAAEAIVGYASKVSFETSWNFGQTNLWPLDAIKSYLLTTMQQSRGRQGFRFLVNPKKKKVSSHQTKNLLREPMMTLIG